VARDVLEPNEMQQYGNMNYLPSTSIYMPSQIPQMNKSNSNYQNNNYPLAFAEESPNNNLYKRGMNEPERFLNDQDAKKPSEFENDKEPERGMEMDFSIFPDEKNESRY